MLRWLGAALILCGALLTRQALLESTRRAQRTRLALAAAFEAMEAEIHLLLTPLPSLLRRSWGAESDAFFETVSKLLRSGATLAEAWRRAAENLPLPREEREAVALMAARLCGGEESVCAALMLAASQLRQSYDRFEARRTENERLTTSISISIGLFLAIFLF